jgi:hypothetical protein
MLGGCERSLVIVIDRPSIYCADSIASSAGRCRTRAKSAPLRFAGQGVSA